MKDYRLSEIQNHNFNELWALSDDIAKRRLEFEFLRKAQYSLEHLDIEPRDMIELPYKQQFYVNEGTFRPRTVWSVIFRDNISGACGIESFNTEPEADEFIAKLKEKNNE